METTQPVRTVDAERNNEQDAPFNPRQALDLDAVESLRERQRRAYEQTLQSGQDQNYSQELTDYYAERSVERTVDDYLGAQGLTPRDSQYDTYRRGLMDLSVTHVPESEWYAKFKDDSDTELDQSGRDKTRAFYEQVTGEPYYGVRSDAVSDTTADTTPMPAADTTDGSNPDTATTEVLTTPTEDERLKNMRDLLSTLAARRQGRLMGKGGNNYQEALELYNDRVIEVGKLKHQDILEDPNLSEHDKRLRVVSYLFDEQVKLREETVTKLKNTHVGKFVEFMNRGSRGMRFAKGTSLVLLGTGIGALAGVAGLATIGVAAGAGAVGFARYARGFAQRDASRGDSMMTFTQEADRDALRRDATVEDAPEAGTHLESLQSFFNQKFEKDTKEEQSKRRKSAIWGLGGIAVGAGAGLLLSAASDVANNGSGGYVRELLTPDVDAKPDIDVTPDPEITPNPETTPDPDDIPEKHFGDDKDGLIDTDGDSEYPPVDTGDLDGDGEVDNGGEVIGDADFNIESGEGGIHFFQRLGLTESQWYEAQNDLLNKFPDEFYAHQEDGFTDVRINRPGQLPTAVQDYIERRFGL